MGEGEGGRGGGGVANGGLLRGGGGGRGGPPGLWLATSSACAVTPVHDRRQVPTRATGMDTVGPPRPHTVGYAATRAATREGPRGDLATPLQRKKRGRGGGERLAVTATATATARHRGRDRRRVRRDGALSAVFLRLVRMPWYRRHAAGDADDLPPSPLPHAPISPTNEEVYRTTTGGRPPRYVRRGQRRGPRRPVRRRVLPACPYGGCFHRLGGVVRPRPR